MSLFGGQPSTPAPSFFNTAPQQSPTPFGAPTQPQQTPTPFGVAAQQQTPTPFGVTQPPSSSYNPQNQPPPPPPPVTTGRTRISSLPPALQEHLFAVERHLRLQRQKAHKLWTVHRPQQQRAQEMLNLQLVEASRNVTKLRADMQTLHCNSGALRDAVRVQRGLATEIAAGGVPDRYFEAIVDELEGRLHEYKKELNHIGEFMKARGERGNVSGKTIEDVIRRLYGYFMVVAGRVADVNENLKAVRELYVRVVEGENRGGGDCFERADLREKVERERERALTESFVTMEGGGQPVTAGVGGAIMVPGGGQTQMAGSGALGGSTWFNDASSSADAFGTNGNAGGQTKRLSGGRRKRN